MKKTQFSFVLSAIDLWNKLPEQLRNVTKISPFKQNLLKYMSRRVDEPHHFLHGPRPLSVIHSRLRNNCSDLKFDLYNNHVKGRRGSVGCTSD